MTARELWISPNCPHSFSPMENILRLAFKLLKEAEKDLPKEEQLPRVNHTLLADCLSKFYCLSSIRSNRSMELKSKEYPMHAPEYLSVATYDCVGLILGPSPLGPVIETCAP